jgi:hypothetical protein
VYEDLDGVPGGPGRAVQYTTGNVLGVPGPHKLTLPNAMTKLLSIQYIDGAGNVLLKSFKGKLFQAVPVDIRTSVFTRGAPTTIQVSIAAFGALTAPVLEVDFGDGASSVLPLVDAQGNPASFVFPQPDGSALAFVQHDYTAVPGNAVTVIARVSAQGAGGSDTATLYNCGDARGDTEIPSGDVVSCTATTAGGVAAFDLNLAAAPATPQLAYRIEFPALGTSVALSGEDLSPSSATYSLLPLGVHFEVPASAIGWNGVSPLDFRMVTTQRSNGATVDQTLTFTLTP